MYTRTDESCQPVVQPQYHKFGDSIPFSGECTNKLLVNYKANFHYIVAHMDKEFEPEEDQELSFGWDDEEPIEVQDTWLEK